MRVLWVGAVLVLASACGSSADEPPPAREPCEAPFAQGEFGTNFAVVAALSNAPAVGETATLTVGVCAKEAARAAVSVTLPDGVEWRTPPEDMTVTTRPGTYEGCAQVATGERELRAMTPLKLVGTVVATKPGSIVLDADVTYADHAHPDPGNSTVVAITVGTDSSYFGYPEDFSHSSATSGPRPVPVCD